MEKAKEYLSVPEDEAEAVSRLTVPARPPGNYPSYYESFTLRGLIVDRVERGLIVCTFTVPSRLADHSGNLATGAIANLVDEIGYAVLHVEGVPICVSVNMSISYLSTAKAGDKLEITSKVLGQRGAYSGTMVLLRNKESGEIIAEGRHSLFSPHASKL
ncbi:putative esterase F42H10.6 [Punica granatum]|uniref:Esterase F42H10.6 n=2 Tax=Punica granatum TaxID=22663 RepID=A0A6P8BXZ8_PUNGR|nr:putative esterase F42H10.6 [Punica granatum]XP_031399691.1 putative esterase F42H10.6 [Punica granatum]OWM68759.1 hypothetical protein CDL15_Pgr024946 [Punica granatum]PKI66469.1 hypothetical protein CRG98_013125 [Punica granatum]